MDLHFLKLQENVLEGSRKSDSSRDMTRQGVTGHILDSTPRPIEPSITSDSWERHQLLSPL